MRPFFTLIVGLPLCACQTSGISPSLATQEACNHAVVGTRYTLCGTVSGAGFVSAASGLVVSGAVSGTADEQSGMHIQILGGSFHGIP